MGFDNIPRLSRIEAAILDVLIARGETFGLEIARASDGAVKQGTLYVTLNRMAEKGYVTSRQEERAPGGFGPPRRLYKVTGLGERVSREWARFAGRFARLPRFA